MRYADVILPLAVPGIFTYALPEGLRTVEPGMRVGVPFGRGRKLYSAVVLRVHDTEPVQRSPRTVFSVLDEHPVVMPTQLALWERMADHYLCTLGEVMIAALPAPLALSSETRLVAADDAAPAKAGRGAPILQVLAHRETLTLEQAGEVLGLKDPMPVVRDLMDQGLLMLEESLRETWKPKMVAYVRLAPGAASEETLHGWFDTLERKAPKQLHLLMRYVELSRCLSEHPVEVERTKLLNLSGCAPSVLKPLVDKGRHARRGPRRVGATPALTGPGGGPRRPGQGPGDTSRGPAARRHQQRQDRGVHGAHGRGAGSGPPGALHAAGDRPHHPDDRAPARPLRRSRGGVPLAHGAA
jgi:primosomal protein N' (replication factor Y)